MTDKDAARSKLLQDVSLRLTSYPLIIAFLLGRTLITFTLVKLLPLFDSFGISHLTVLIWILTMGTVVKVCNWIERAVLLHLTQKRMGLAGALDFNNYSDFEKHVLQDEGLGVSDEEKTP